MSNKRERSEKAKEFTFEPYDMPTRIKELEFIQDIIKRMSDRQVTTKNLCMLILGAISVSYTHLTLPTIYSV